MNNTLHFREKDNKRKIAHCKYIRLIQRELDHILGKYLHADLIECVKNYCMFEYEFTVKIPRCLKDFFYEN